MSPKPLALVQIDDMARHVQATMRRAPDPVGDSLVRTLGGMLMHCLRQHLKGQWAHPGLTKAAKMGRCSERQARRNIRQLEAWGVLHAMADAQGGHRATRYRVNLIALKRALVLIGANPSKELIEKIEASGDRIRADMRADTRADIRGDTMSAGNSTREGSTCLDGVKALSNGLTLVSGGRS